jgi:hypothetical protein
VIGSPLNNDVASAQDGFTLLENQGNFAMKHNSIVNGFCTMHIRMARSGRSPMEIACTYLREYFVEVIIRLIGGNVEHSEPGTTGWREQG